MEMGFPFRPGSRMAVMALAFIGHAKIAWREFAQKPGMDAFGACHAMNSKQAKAKVKRYVFLFFTAHSP